MKIILGSKSKDKISILENALGELHLKPEIIGVEVNLEIINQPLWVLLKFI